MASCLLDDAVAFGLQALSLLIKLPVTPSDRPVTAPVTPVKHIPTVVTALWEVRNFTLTNRGHYGWYIFYRSQWGGHWTVTGSHWAGSSLVAASLASHTCTRVHPYLYHLAQHLRPCASPCPRPWQCLLQRNHVGAYEASNPHGNSALRCLQRLLSAQQLIGRARV